MRRQAAVTAADFLEPESVIPELAAATRVSAIQELAGCVARHPDAPGRDEIAEWAMAREREFGTAIGCGVAIPHVRLDGLKNPVLAFGRSPDGIAWDAPDGRPVHHAFFLATPGGTADLHVQILAAIARISQVAENRQRLADAPDSTSLFAALKMLLVTEQRHGTPNKSDAGDGK